MNLHSLGRRAPLSDEFQCLGYIHAKESHSKILCQGNTRSAFVRSMQKCPNVTVLFIVVIFYCSLALLLLTINILRASRAQSLSLTLSLSLYLSLPHSEILLQLSNSSAKSHTVPTHDAARYRTYGRKVLG